MISFKGVVYESSKSIEFLERNFSNVQRSSVIEIVRGSFGSFYVVRRGVVGEGEVRGG